MNAVYIRVSSHSQNLDSQRAEITQWLNQNDFDLAKVQWFEDTESGTTLDRPAFKKMQKAIFNGEVKTVIVWKLDRLARKIKEGINTIADWCDKEIRIISTTQQIDLKGPTGHLLASMLFGIAEIELQHSKERQQAGIAVAKTKGIYTGRQKGATKSKPERALELKQKGLNEVEISMALNISERTVFRYLKAFKDILTR
jgi:DNA invertase Pin-like site-specific DNA recombinase